MRYYPVNLDIKMKHCLVVGGGAVATRKVITLVNCDASVTVVSPEVTEALKELAEKGTIVVEKRPYRPSDLDGKFLVIGATNIEHLNSNISSDALHKNILCNIVDQPEACNFILPSIVNRGDLIIAISTSGKSPAFSKQLRKDLEKEFGEEYADFLRLMGAIRRRLLSSEHAPEAHKSLFNKLISGGLITLIKDRKIQAINHLLMEILGKGYEFDILMQDAS